MARTLEPESLETAPDASAAQSLRDLERINRWTGGFRTLARLLDPYLRLHPDATILDAGAANGATVAWLTRRFPRARFLALDYSERFLQQAPGERVLADVRRWPIRRQGVDIVISSLFLHHFPDTAVAGMLADFEESARLAVICVDLHRHPIARGFLPFTRPLARWHPLTVSDGILSVNAGFVPAELRRLAPRARVRMHWPWFRLSIEIPSTRSR